MQNDVESSIQFNVKPPKENTSVIARNTFYLAIQDACQRQIGKLQDAGGELNLQKATHISEALTRLDFLIRLKDEISGPEVTQLVQKNGEEDILRLHAADFSDLQTVLHFQSRTWSWDKPWAGGKFKLLHSVQDALNISLHNIFNVGFFKRAAYYGPLYGETAMLQEARNDIKNILEKLSVSTPSPSPLGSEPK